ncbi:MAG: hypothetical protein ACYDEQ_03985, partial [Desulfocucumaceae bacterium]
AHYYIGKMRKCIEDFIKNPPIYDYFEILNLAIKLIVAQGDLYFRHGEQYIPYHLLIAASERLICSALIDRVYYEAGIDLFPNRVSKHITPAEIASLADEKNQVLYMVYKNNY